MLKQSLVCTNLERHYVYLTLLSAARCCRKLLADKPQFYVPDVIHELSTRHILTTELVNGVALDKLQDIDQTTKDKVGWISTRVVYLTSRKCTCTYM